MPGCVLKALFDPSYTTDGVLPMQPWGRTRHALNPAIPTLIDGFVTDLLDPVRVSQEISEIAGLYGELLRKRDIPNAGLALACEALRHAFDDTARWVVRHRAIEPPLAVDISWRVADLAENAIEMVNQSYAKYGWALKRANSRVAPPPSDFDLFAFPVAR